MESGFRLSTISVHLHDCSWAANHRFRPVLWIECSSTLGPQVVSNSFGLKKQCIRATDASGNIQIPADNYSLHAESYQDNLAKTSRGGQDEHERLVNSGSQTVLVIAARILNG